MKDLSEKFKCNFVNQYELIPKSEKYFVDSMHFTPDGMKKLSENFKKTIMEDF
jgi:hypothetical protein